MTLVERLRSGHPSIDLYGAAADEIERLRKAYEEKCTAYSEAVDEVERLDDDIERLRAERAWFERKVVGLETEIERLRGCTERGGNPNANSPV